MRIQNLAILLAFIIAIFFSSCRNEVKKGSTQNQERTILTVDGQVLLLTTLDFPIYTLENCLQTKRLTLDLKYQPK